MKLIKILDIKEKGKTKLCSVCGGEGIVMNDSWGSGVSDKVQCDVCKGTGRIVKCTALCEISVPYNNKKLEEL